MQNFFRKNHKIILIAEAMIFLLATVIVLAEPLPPAPENPKIINDSASVNELSWEMSDKTNCYKIYKASDNGRFSYLGTTEENHFTDKNAEKSDTYKIVSCNLIKRSDSEKFSINESDTVNKSITNDDILAEEEAAAFLRESMKKRIPEVTLKVETDKEISKELFEKAMEHTGVPTEGDYLKFQYGESKADTGISGGVETITYHISYYSTASEEKMVDQKVKEIIDGLDIERKKDSEKIDAIYKYVRNNIAYDTYDYPDNNIKRTAYSALIKGETVCQGYSLALYRLLLEAGIDTRIIHGTGIPAIGPQGAHTWNIVKYNDKYYYMDAAWDNLYNRNTSGMYARNPFEATHIKDEEFKIFDNIYPIAEKSSSTPASISETTIKMLDIFSE